MSSGGAALQLIARGRQDIYLVGNPQITFFKQVYRRYTNFSMESQPIYFDGTANFGRRISAIIPRKGDLLHRMMLEISLPMVVVGDPDTSWVNGIGHALIEEVTIEIGETEIVCTRSSDHKDVRAKHGLYRSLINNMIVGYNISIAVYNNTTSR